MLNISQLGSHRISPGRESVCRGRLSISPKSKQILPPVELQNDQHWCGLCHLGLTCSFDRPLSQHWGPGGEATKSWSIFRVRNASDLS